MKTSSTIKLRIFYTIVLLKEFGALSTTELSKFQEIGIRMMNTLLKKMQEHNLVVKQLQRYKLTKNAESIRYLHELYFV